MNKRLIIVLAFILLVSQVAAGKVTVSFIDVEHGDAILIQSDVGSTILIDGGSRRAGTRVLVPFLQAAGVSKIDLMVATHPHEDHIGGLIPVLEHFPVKQVYADAQIHTTKTYEEFLVLVDRLEIPFYPARAGMEIEIAGINTLEILHPQKTFLSGLNNNSVTLLMEIEDYSFLFTGDIEVIAEQVILETIDLLPVDVLKVAHHGSITSSSVEFLRTVQPNYAVMMTKAGTYNNVPSSVVAKRLDDLGMQVFRTDLDGTVTFTIEQTLTVKTEKSVVDMSSRINLETATTKELVTIPGIGPAIASRIISYREEQGFEQISDLLNISGIGDITYLKIKDYFYLD